ncbi:MAG: cobalamin biosynthesis protein CobG [Pseudomonadota bacterium]
MTAAPPDVVAPSVKGRCPGAHRPMMSGDGLIVRVRPRAGRLCAEAALGLCDLAERHGGGALDLTNRANLQIRGVAAEAHAPLLLALEDLGLLDADAEAERRRNLIVDPFAPAGGLCRRLAEALTEALPRLPALPAKIGFAVDAGPAPILQDAPADLRLERGPAGLILRADCARAGRKVSEVQAIPALIEMAEWLASRLGPDTRRMARVQTRQALPTAWRDAPPAPPAGRPAPGLRAEGLLLGAPFGRLPAEDLRRLLHEAAAPAIRLTPWRMILLEGVRAAPAAAARFITRPDDPLLPVDACPGAPFCASASVETRAVARRLAPLWKGSLHVSGCAKGCARATVADLTLVGRDGAFDLVRGGRAGDAPLARGLTLNDLLRDDLTPQDLMPADPMPHDPTPQDPTLAAPTLAAPTHADP